MSTSLLKHMTSMIMASRQDGKAEGDFKNTGQAGYFSSLLPYFPRRESPKSANMTTYVNYTLLAAEFKTIVTQDQIFPHQI